MLIKKNIQSAIFLIIAGFVVFGTENICAEDKDKSKPDQKTSEYKSYIYKNTPQGDLEIRVHFPPGWREGDERSAIIFFFGGGWTRGSIDQFKPQAEYFASRGMITARVDYRVKNRQGTLADKCVEDGKSAVRWLRTHADELGIDEDRIVASGGSAGAHIAACTFIVKGFETEGEDYKISSKPNLLVLFNPVLDASSATKRVNRMGSDKTAEDLSPNLHLDNNIPPTLLFYGSNDSLLAHGETFVQGASHLNFEAILYTAEGVGHGFFNRKPWLNKTIFLMDQFLEKYRYLEGKPTISVSDNSEMLRIDSREMKK